MPVGESQHPAQQQQGKPCSDLVGRLARCRLHGFFVAPRAHDLVAVLRPRGMLVRHGPLFWQSECLQDAH